MRAELLAVGDELLYGDIINGNAAYLGRELADVGIRLARSVVVGDDVDTISSAVLEALGRAEAVILTGGIGPTQDDLTREGLAAAAGVGLRRDGELERQLRQRFAELGRTMPDMNFRQADVPENGSSLPNSRGTAPGVRLELGGGVAYAMPGVPHEMEAMFTGHVLPDLLVRAGTPAVVVHRVLRTAGMYESAVAQAMGPEVDRLAPVGNPTIAFLASGGQTRVRVSATAPDRPAALALIEPSEQFARTALGIGLYGTDDDTLEGVLHALLAERGATLAVAESLTGGLLAGRLTDIPGASRTFRGGVVTYSTDVKDTLLGTEAVAGGAVTPETAAAMARGVRERLGATWGLSTTGVAGPDEQEGQPVGTLHIGMSGPAGTSTRSLRLPVAGRGNLRTLACVQALDLLRRALLRG